MANILDINDSLTLEYLQAKKPPIFFNPNLDVYELFIRGDYSELSRTIYLTKKQVQQIFFDSIIDSIENQKSRMVRVDNVITHRNSYCYKSDTIIQRSIPYHLFYEGVYYIHTTFVYEPISNDANHHSGLKLTIHTSYSFPSIPKIKFKSNKIKSKTYLFNTSKLDNLISSVVNLLI